MLFNKEKYKTDSVYRNQITSYLAVISSIITGILTLPIIIYFLELEELGVWALITQVMLYLMLIDGGVGVTAGRMMADSIIEKDQDEIDEWWSLSIAIISLQAIILLVVGLSITQFFLDFYSLEGALREKARWLFIGTVIIFSIKLPTNVFPGILTAQNRFHWVSINQVTFGWIRISTLWICFLLGLGLMSYLVVEAILLVANIIYYSYAVRKGGLKVKLTRFEKSKIKRLFGFSTSQWLIGICNTVINSAPTIVVGKVLGVAAVPVFTITNRIPTIVKSFTSRTMQSYYPSFQQQIIRGDIEGGELKLNKAIINSIYTSLILGLGVLALNRSVITLMGDSQFYGGMNLTLSFVLLSVTAIFIEGSLYSLQASGRMKKISIVVMIEALITAGLSYIAVKKIGFVGPVLVVMTIPMLTRVMYGYFVGFNAIKIRRSVVFKGVFKTLMIAIALFGGAYYLLNNFSSHSSWFPNATELSIAILAGIFLIIAYKLKNKKPVTHATV